MTEEKTVDAIVDAEEDKEKEGRRTERVDHPVFGLFHLKGSPTAQQEFRLSVAQAIGTHRIKMSTEEIFDVLIVELLGCAELKKIRFRWLLKRIAYVANEMASEEYWGQVKNDIPKELLVEESSVAESSDDNECD